MIRKNLSPRNRGLSLSEQELADYKPRTLKAPVDLRQIINSIICQDVFEILPWLPAASFDLIFADPPYNLTKNFGGLNFGRQSMAGYQAWLETWLPPLARLLKPEGAIYICGDWRSSAALHLALDKFFVVQNRITWEREKGRAAKRNWKNASEDIWFATCSPDYAFYGDRVKLKRKVLAPYTDEQKRPKDWQAGEGRPYRLTAPSNLWTDITVPFWSMPENTSHPTQKPEKLLAKIILASTRPADVVFDPFVGVGSSAVVARKLGRGYVGVEINPAYCALAEKRLALATTDKRIQGYEEGVFWERNSRP